MEEWIKRLNEATKERRDAIVGELAASLNIKKDEAYKRLKDAGWPPKDKPKDKEESAAGGKLTMRHKTDYRHYRRAGLILTQQFAEYDVTETQTETLKNDPWVEIKGAETK